MKAVSGFAAVMLLTVAFGTAACAQTAAPAASAAAPAAPAITRNVILTTPLDGLPGYDGIMYVTDIPPGMVAPRHVHPGYEFNYILKGAITFTVDGEAPVTKHAGESIYNVRGHIHTVKNASATEPAELVAVLINAHGQPLAVTVDPAKNPPPPAPAQ